MTNGDKFDQVFGIGQSNLAIASCAWWDDQYIQPIQTNMYDQEETHTNCTVQVLTNSVTGEVSIGWWENKEDGE